MDVIEALDYEINGYRIRRDHAWQHSCWSEWTRLSGLIDDALERRTAAVQEQEG